MKLDENPDTKVLKFYHEPILKSGKEREAQFWCVWISLSGHISCFIGRAVRLSDTEARITN